MLTVALCDEKFSQTEGNSRKLFHTELTVKFSKSVKVPSVFSLWAIVYSRKFST